MPTWTIKGEAGKGLDDTSRTVQALGITSAELTTGSLTDDIFGFTMETTTAAGAGIDGVARIPTAGQIIELFCDGTRRFKGNAMLPEVGLSQVSVQVQGPWYWMRNIPVISSPGGAVDASTDADGTRPTVVFPTQGLRESIRTLINAAKDAGVPVQNIGTGEVADFIDTMFTALKTTITGATWADALIELMKWCLDAVAWWDYTTATPKLRVTRRGSMATKTLTVGVDILEGMSIRPRVDLKIDRVDLHYVTRHPQTGRPRWARQSSNPAVTPATGKLQIVPVSGADVTDLVPIDDFDTYGIKTTEYYEDIVNKTESSLVGVRKTYGSQVAIAVTNGTPYSLWRAWQTTAGGLGSPNKSYGTVAAGTAKPSFVLPSGTNLKLAGRYFLYSDSPPDWIKTWKNQDGLALNVREGTLSGMMVAEFFQSPNSTGNFNTLVVPQWVTALGMTKLIEGYLESQRVTVYSKPFSISCKVVSLSYPTLTTLYQPWQWDYLEVPANLAANLQTCQSFTPWEGTIPTIETVTGENLMQYKINVAGSIAAHASMGALLKNVKQDILKNRVTYTLGPPPVVDYRDRIGMLMSQKIDRVKYL